MKLRFGFITGCLIILLHIARALSQCPDYLYNQTFGGLQETLPDGFFVYGRDDSLGLFISPIRQFSDKVIPGTETHNPLDIGISPDGKWILYRNSITGQTYLTNSDGSRRATVPSTGYVGFYYNSPYGTEIAWIVGNDSLRSTRVDLTKNPPTFSSARPLASLKNKFWLTVNRVCIVKDAFFGRVSPLPAGQFSPAWRTGYLTIPDDGKGVAGPEHVYRFDDPDTTLRWGGCSHALSRDTKFSVSNPATSWGTPECQVGNHLGFNLTPFRYYTDSSMTPKDHINKFGTSINHSPAEYRWGTGYEVDFSDYWFGNRPDYLICRQVGTESPVHGVWLIHWKTNTWVLLTPQNRKISARQPAVHFTDTLSRFTLRTSSGAHGQLLSDSIHILNGGDSAKVICAARYGYTFNHWQVAEGSAIVRDSTNDTTWVTPLQDTWVRALWNAQPCSLKIIPDSSGSIAVDPAAGLVRFADTLQLTATPRAGYKFVGWTTVPDTGLKLTNSASPTTSAIVNSLNISISAVFAQGLTTILIASSEGGITIPDDSLVSAFGAQALIRAFPDTGWHFAGWKTDSGDVAFTDTLSDSALITVNGDRAKISVRFEIDSFPLLLRSNGNGSIRVVGSLKPAYDAPCTLEAIPDSGYHFEKWRVVSGNILLSDSLSPNVIARIRSEKSVIEARFQSDYFSVSIQDSGKGTVFPDQPVLVHYQDSLGIHASSDSGFIFLKWIIKKGIADLADAHAESTTVIPRSDALLAAVFIDTSLIDPLDPSNPKYRILAPNGGERFVSGEQCTVRVRSSIHAEAIVKLSVGSYSFMLPGLDNVIDPKTDSVILFTIPPWFERTIAPGQFDTVTIAGACKIIIEDYSNPGVYRDESDSSFFIEPHVRTALPIAFPEKFSLAIRSGNIYVAIPQRMSEELPIRLSVYAVDLRGRRQAGDLKRLLGPGHHIIHGHELQRRRVLGGPGVYILSITCGKTRLVKSLRVP